MGANPRKVLRKMNDTPNNELKGKNRQEAKTDASQDQPHRRLGNFSFSDIFLHSPIGIYIVQNGKFRFVNPAFQEIANNRSGLSFESRLTLHKSVKIMPEIPHGPGRS
jgi:PAS domain-containing protein